MDYRRQKQWACLLGLCGTVIGFAICITCILVDQKQFWPIGFVVLTPGLLVAVIFVVPSFALQREYGLWGSKQLRAIPEAMPDEPWIVTSGKIGRRYHVSFCLPVIVGEPGIALTLISGDRVFIERDVIDCIVATSSWWLRIEHSDDQIHSPIVLWTLFSLGSNMRRLFPEKFADGAPTA